MIKIGMERYPTMVIATITVITTMIIEIYTWAASEFVRHKRELR